ncbi:MAG: NADP-dependent oxidoreductase [Acidobacteria bacterium]|nr:NADP-dependent oxidoreductase [Acidobacteriota bacterium]
MPMNRQITLAARPVGYPKETDFNLVETPVPTPGPKEVLLRTIYLSLDPYMRGRMNDASSYAPPVAIGEVMVGGTVGKVSQSDHPGFVKGDIVLGMGGWQEYAVSDGRALRKLDPQEAPISTALGVLGMPGLSAYFGLLEIGQPKPGETVVISAAAGAVGSVAGQIAKMGGCRAVGIAGTDAKINYLVGDLKLDAAFNYRSVENHHAVLKEICPDGIDVYFDNVGGPITEAVFPLLRPRARVVVCGQISQYNLERPETGPRLLPRLLLKQARAEGFLVTQFADRYPAALRQLTRWLQEGKLKFREDIVDGLSNAPGAFIAMLNGRNMGKMLVKLGAP